MTFLHTENSEIALTLAYIVLICPCPTICPRVKKIKNILRNSLPHEDVDGYDVSEQNLG